MTIFKHILLVLVLHIFLGECSVLYQKAGTDLTIQCPGVSSKDDVEWKYNDLRIVRILGKSGSKMRGSLFPKDSKKYSPDTTSLKINRLETSDSGRYSCSHRSEYEYTVHVVSVSVKPGTVLPLSSDAELNCNVGDPKAEVQWLRPPNAQLHPERKPEIINLKSVTSNDGGQWTCRVKGLEINVTLTVVGLQTKETIDVPQGGDIVLPCSLPQQTSWRVVGGKWKADHLAEVSSTVLKITDNTLQWMGQTASRVVFASGQLNINYDMKLTKVQPSDAGRFECTVEFDGGATLTASTTLTVLPGTTGNKVVASVNGRTSKTKGPWTNNVFGVQLWIWIAVGASSLVLIGVIIVIVYVQRRNKRIKKRVRQLRSMRQPLTAKDYCQCDRSEREEESVKQVRPVPVPRHPRNANNRTKPYNGEGRVY